MKKIYSIVTGLLIAASVWAQAPQKMSYQAVIRNSSGTLITSTPVGMKISVLQGSATGTVSYSETQTPSTNDNGLVSIEIGSGTPVIGTFAGINWAAGPYFIKSETDPTGGTTYSIVGTTQLLSVPYALFSASGIGAGSAAGNTPYWNGTSWITNSSNIFNNGGNVGIGTSNPLENLVISEPVGAVSGSQNFLLVETIVNPFLSSSQGVIMRKDDGAKRGFKLFHDGSNDLNSVFKITSFSASADIDRLTIKRDNGNVGIGTNDPKSKLQVVGLPVFADNSSAIAGGLTVGAFYRTAVGVLMVVF